MLTLNLVSPTNVMIPSMSPRRGEATNEPQQKRSATDGRIDLAELTKRTDTASESDVISAERIQALRDRISSGTYLTPEKLDVVADRLHSEIFGGV